MRLLLTEDNLRLSTLVCRALEKEGFAVDAVGSLGESEAAIETTDYDAVILDLGLPDGNGLDLLRVMRSREDTTPVLILTARDGVEDRVMGLNAGADDYLLKPFANEELIARVRALLRRPGGALGVKLKAGNITFDTTTREVRVDDVLINISRREMGVLEQLMRRPGHVVPKDMLEEKLYGFDEGVSSNSVEVHISRLRKRMSNYQASVTIHTLRGVGYLLAEEAPA